MKSLHARRHSQRHSQYKYQGCCRAECRDFSSSMINHWN